MSTRSPTATDSLAFAFVVAALALTSHTASAGFVGWNHEVIQLASGRVAMNIYVVVNNPGDRLILIGNSKITTNTTGGFFQSQANPFWSPGPQNPADADDSFVTIGSNPVTGLTSPSGTGSDPNFVNFNDDGGATDFSQIISVPGSGGAGWFGTNPNSINSRPINGRILVAHFVAGDGSAPPSGYVRWQAMYFLKLASGDPQYSMTPAEIYHWDGSDTPAPSALVALAFMPALRRRRRC